MLEDEFEDYQIGSMKIAVDSPDYGEFIAVAITSRLDGEDDIHFLIVPDNSDRVSIELDLNISKARELLLLIQQAIITAEEHKKPTEVE